MFQDYHERVFFRRFYGGMDAETKARRDVKMEAVRVALEEAGVMFEIRDTGFSYINIHYTDTPENCARLVSGAANLGVDLSDIGSWAVKSVGDLMFQKTT